MSIVTMCNPLYLCSVPVLAVIFLVVAFVRYVYAL